VIAVARVLFSRYLLPFEVTSILLVVAVVGVMVLTRRITAASKYIAAEEPAPERKDEVMV
jgi:NADH-quinone oxidoreductase subunit J